MKCLERHLEFQLISGLIPTTRRIFFAV